MLGTPVVTHTSVVFVRLYWFEKHLRNTVHLSRSRSQRPSRSRSRLSNDKARNSRGVDGRTIVVFHSNNQLQNHQASKINYEKANEKDTEKWTTPPVRTATEQLEVKFPSSNSTTLPSSSSQPRISDGVELGQDETPDPRHKMMAQQRSLDRHIAIKEQRHPKDDIPLRVFGPRQNLRGSEGDSHDQINRVPEATC